MRICIGKEGICGVKNNLVSFVIPCYNSENTISDVVHEINITMRGANYEIILVNDASIDDTFKVISDLSSCYNNVVAINLNKNFGQHAALMAGFHYVRGEVIVCMDDDGQTPASEVDKLLDEIRAGRDAVYAKYPVRKQSTFRKLGSDVNEFMLRFMLDKPNNLAVSSYFAIKRLIVDEMIKYTNPYPYVIGLVLRSTRNISNVEVEHRERINGKSGYNFHKLFALWMNGLTAFSIKPLRIATGFGAVMAIGAFVYGIITIIMKILGINYVLGFSALMTVVTFIGGINLVMMGMIGEYIGRIYISLNESPQFIVKDVVDNRG